MSSQDGKIQNLRGDGKEKLSLKRLKQIHREKVGLLLFCVHLFYILQFVDDLYLYPPAMDEL